MFKESAEKMDNVLRTHDPEKVNAVLSEFGSIMKRESDIYRKLQVSLSYDYTLMDGEKVNVINFSCVKDGQRIFNQMCFYDGLDFLECVIGLLSRAFEISDNVSCPCGCE